MNVTDILKAKKISCTEVREKILSAMLYKEPLSRKEITSLVDIHLNRITLYRTLREFIDKNIMVRIQDDKGVEKFFLNYENKNEHIHFKCSCCDKLFSFPGEDLKLSLLPKGYVAREKKLFITGVCNKCNKMHRFKNA